MIEGRSWFFGALSLLIACGSNSSPKPMQAGTGAAAGVAGTAGQGGGGANGGATSGGGGGTGPRPAVTWAASVELEATGDVYQVVDAASASAGGIWVAFGAPALNIARFAPESGWSSAEFSSAGTLLRPPRIASSVAGTSVAVWGESVDGARRIASAYHGGTSWSQRVELGPGADSIEDIELTMNDAGRAVSVWITITYGADIDSHRYVVAGTAFDGQSWSPVAEVASRVGGFLAWVRVAIDSQGRALAIWRDSDGGNPRTTNIAASRFDGSSWTAPEVVSMVSGSDAAALDVALHPSGRGLVAWRRESLLARTFDPATGFAAEQTLEEGYDTGFVTTRVRSENEGLVVWSRDDIVRIRPWLAGGGFGDVVEIAPANGQTIGQQDVASDALGNTAVAWASSPSSIAVHASIQRPGAAWSAVRTLDATAGPSFNDFTYPAVVLGNDGQAMVAWAHLDANRVGRVHASYTQP